jgi:hypothetical protein
MRSRFRIYTSVVLSAVLCGLLVMVSCKSNITGPTDSNPVDTTPRVVLTPRIAMIGQPTHLNIIPYNMDSGAKHYIVYFSKPADTLYTTGAATYNFQTPGTYRYIIQAYDQVNGKVVQQFRDTGTIIVYLFTSSITPSMLQGAVNKPYTFTVRPDSVLTGTNYTYYWTFGDSTKTIIVKNADTVGVSFAAAGIYPIDVKIYDNVLGVVSEAVGAISVNTNFQGLTLTPRVAVVNHPVLGTLWHPALPHGDSHTDTWDFGDGTIVTGLNNQDTLSHTYSKLGRFIVKGEVFDNASGALVFVASDTAFISSVDYSSVSISPSNVNVSSGQTILFRVSHPQLDPHHAYHWLWNSNGTPTQSSLMEGTDTLSIQFVWPGTDSVLVRLLDDSLGSVVASARTTVQVSLASGFARSMLLTFSKVQIDFVGAHQYNSGDAYLGNPGTDWSYHGQDSLSVGSHLNGDTIYYYSGYDQKDNSTSMYGYTNDETSSSETVRIVLSQDGMNCLIARGTTGYYVSDYSTDRGQDNGTYLNEASAFQAVNLPLVAFSSGIIVYGVQGSVAQSNLGTATYSNSASWLHGAQPSGCDYLTTDWTNAQPSPQISVTFKR